MQESADTQHETLMIGHLSAEIRHPVLPGRTRGQAMLEFALALPVLVLLLFGVLDAGRAVFDQIALSNAASVSARYAALSCSPAAACVVSTPASVSACAGPLTGVCSTIIAAALGVDISQIMLRAVVVDPTSVSLVLTYSFHAATPFIDNALGGSLTLTAGASALIG